MNGPVVVPRAVARRRLFEVEEVRHVEEQEEEEQEEEQCYYCAERVNQDERVYRQVCDDPRPKDKMINVSAPFCSDDCFVKMVTDEHFWCEDCETSYPMTNVDGEDNFDRFDEEVVCVECCTQRYLEEGTPHSLEDMTKAPKIDSDRLESAGYTKQRTFYIETYLAGTNFAACNRFWLDLTLDNKAIIQLSPKGNALNVWSKANDKEPQDEEPQDGQTPPNNKKRLRA
jgi:hypothetical protein